MGRIEIVSMIRINGEKVYQSSIPEEEFEEILEEKMDRTMSSFHFEKKKDRVSGRKEDKP